MDFGSAGTLRLFIEPLTGEASWLLPFALGGIVLLAVVLHRRPYGERQIAFILWAGWLLSEAFHFTNSRASRTRIPSS